jgi:hypothetical protein
MGISNASGGMGKNELSTKETPPSHHMADLRSAKPNVQL